MDILFIISLICALVLLVGLLAALWLAYQEFNEEE